ncbi:hypothetical protein VTJ04DRAFT_2555 [Mycothermus thermophilus]|uniref:uncharacterized protein n=1 Tax=Humicola insolens TaxID=85995 RepID=UPI003743B252
MEMAICPRLTEVEPAATGQVNHPFVCPSVPLGGGGGISPLSISSLPLRMDGYAQQALLLLGDTPYSVQSRIIKSGARIVDGSLGSRETRRAGRQTTPSPLCLLPPVTPSTHHPQAPISPRHPSRKIHVVLVLGSNTIKRKIKRKTIENLSIPLHSAINSTSLHRTQHRWHNALDTSRQPSAPFPCHSMPYFYLGSPSTIQKKIG